MNRFKALVCALFGHSRLVTNCFFYKYCARCGAQVADGLLGPLPKPGWFQVGQTCTCDECRKAFDNLRWIDRWLCPKAEFPKTISKGQNESPSTN